MAKFDTERQLQDRPLAPNGVIVQQKDLQFEAGSRAFHILRRQLDSAASGVVSGLLVTINPSNSALVDVALGIGYAPNGAFIEVEADQFALAMPDLSSGALNYVAAVYTETQDQQQGHEADGTNPATRALGSSRLRVYTNAQILALPTTSDDLSVDAQDRLLILAEAAISGGVVDTLTLPISTARVLSAAFVSPSPPTTGISIVGIDQGTSTTAIVGANGTVFFTQATSGVRWQAPGDAAGVEIVLTPGQPVTVASSNGRTIDLIADADLLPAVDASAEVIIYGLFSGPFTQEPVPLRYSSRDALLRSLRGSGLPAENNPLGLALSDLNGPVDTDGDIETANDFVAGGTYTLRAARTRTIILHASELQGRTELEKTTAAVDLTAGGSVNVIQTVDPQMEYNEANGGSWKKVGSATTGNVHVPIHIPHGATLKTLRVRLNKVLAGTATLNVFKKTQSSIVAGTLIAGPFTVTGTGGKDLFTSSPIDEVIDAAAAYYAKVDLPAVGDEVHSAQITYTLTALLADQ